MGVGLRKGLVHFEQRSDGTSINRQIRGGWWAPCGWRRSFGESGRVGSEVALLRYDMLPHFTPVGQSHCITGVKGSIQYGPGTSCVVARAAGKPSCWRMGVQARSGAGPVQLHSLASP